MNVIGFTYLLFLIKPSIEDDLLKETISINAQNIKELIANVSSLWAEIKEIETWTQQHEKGVNHNNFGSYRGYHHNVNHAMNGHHPYDNHALNGHHDYYGGHSHWHHEMFPPRVMYHYHDIVPGRDHLFQSLSNGYRKHSSNRKKPDDSSEEEEEDEEEEKEKDEEEKVITNKDNKKEKENEKKNKVKKVEHYEVKKLEEEELEEEEVKKLEGVEREEVKKVEDEEDVKNSKVEENKEGEEVMNGEMKENEKTPQKVENFTEEELGDGEVKGDIKVKEEKKVEADEEEDQVKLRGRSLFGRKKKTKQGHKLGGLFWQHDRKGHKNLVHNIKSHSKTKNHPVNHTKKLDENEIISKAFCDLEPNVEMPESKVTGNVTIFQKRNSIGPLYFHVNLQGFPVGQDEANRTHGFHIHVNPLSQIGHCNSTGPHFNPNGLTHGSLHSDIRHLGDFGNMVVDKNGRLYQYIFVDSTNTLVGENSLIFKSIDVHENPDDLGNGSDEGSLLSGNAGRMLACCTIHTLADALTKLNG